MKPQEWSLEIYRNAKAYNKNARKTAFTEANSKHVASVIRANKIAPEFCRALKRAGLKDVRCFEAVCSMPKGFRAVIKTTCDSEGTVVGRGLEPALFQRYSQYLRALLGGKAASAINKIVSSVARWDKSIERYLNREAVTILQKENRGLLEELKVRNKHQKEAFVALDAAEQRQAAASRRVRAVHLRSEQNAARIAENLAEGERR